jgi:DNA (cytosine-5)-methyltransferase 1
VPGKKRGRHLYWTNFNLPSDLNERKSSIIEGKDEVKRLCDFHDYNFYQYKGKQRIDKIARNLVDYEAGKTIFNVAMGILQNTNNKQQSLFNI